MTIITVTVEVVDSGRVDSQRKTNGVFIATQLNSTQLNSNRISQSGHFTQQHQQSSRETKLTYLEMKLPYPRLISWACLIKTSHVLFSSGSLDSIESTCFSITWNCSHHISLALLRFRYFHFRFRFRRRRKTLISNRGRWSLLSLFRQVHLGVGKSEYNPAFSGLRAASTWEAVGFCGSHRQTDVLAK